MSNRRWRLTELNLLAGGYAAWLASYPLSMLLLSNYEIGSAIAICAAMILCALQLLLRPQDLPSNPAVWLYIGLFGIVILLSQMFGNFDHVDMSAVLRSGVMIALLFITACVATPSLFRMILPIYAIFVSIDLLLVYATGDFVWGRLMAGAAPNYWGLIALSGAITAFSIQSKLLKAFALGVPALILYSTNSRGSMVGAFAGILTSVTVIFLLNGTRRRVAIFAAVCAIFLAAAISEITNSFISDELLRIHDPRRGLDSDFSGRLAPWAFSLNLAGERPFFGYGYRQSETFFGPALGISSAHNGYLSMLIDTGIIGLLLYLCFIGHATVRGFSRMRGLTLSYCALGYVVGYMVVGIFERYALNAGQPLSILFLISAFYLLSRRQIRVHAGTYVSASAVPVSHPTR